MSEFLNGSCQCGAVTIQVEGPPAWIAHCHCNACRRATSAAMSTYVGCKRSTVTLMGQEPKTYISSKGVKRSFCGECGSPIAYEAERWADEIHFFIGLFDHPEDLIPTGNSYEAEKLAWLHLVDGAAKADEVTET